MPAMQNTQSVALQLENCRDKVPLQYERDDVLLNMIQQRGDVERVSSRNMRLPLQLVPGGKAGSYNADGGDLGRGSGSIYDVAQISPIFFRFAIKITKLIEYATDAREKSLENAVKREVANGMKQFRSFLDKLMQTAGNGVFGTVGSFAGTTWTMATPPGLPPEAYGSARQWYAQTMERADGQSIPALGPYPDRGEYEHCFTLEDAHGGFIQLTSTAAEYIARAIEAGRTIDAGTRRKALQAREQRDEKRYDDQAWEMLSGEGTSMGCGRLD